MAVRNTTFNISPVVGFKIDSSVSGTSPNLVSVSATNKVIALLTDTNLPILAEWPYSDVREILNTQKLTELPTALDLSPDSTLLAIGYESGNINVIDVEKRIILKQIKRKDKAGIRFIKFAADSSAFTAVDDDGKINVFTCTWALVILTIKEKTLEYKDMKFTSAYLRKSTDDWLFATDSGTLYFIRITDETELTPSILYEPSDLSMPTMYCDMFKESLLLGVSSAREFNVYTVNQFGVYKLISANDFSKDITHVIYLGNRVYVVILEDNTLQIIKASGQNGEECKSDALESAIKNASVIFAAHQKLFLMNEASCLQLSFLDWGNFLQDYATAGKWDECFDLATGIYTGTNLEYFGIPSSVKKRCNQVKTSMQFIFDSALRKDALPKEVFVKIMTTAGILEMQTFISKTMLEYAKTHFYLEDYFVTLFNDEQDDLSRFCTEESLDVLFTQPPDDVMHLLLDSPILIRFPTKILDFALKHNLLKLLMEMWLKIFDDYLSPCIYLANNEKELYPFLIDVFCNEPTKYVNKVVVCIWLFCVIEDKFPRLYNLMLNNKARAPEIIADCFKLCPIVCRDGTTLTHEMMVDAILRSLNDFYKTIKRESINREHPQIFKILAVVANYILDDNLVVPLYSLKFVIYWIFNDQENIDAREHLLQLINCNYPDIVVLSDLLVECEAAGFTDIITSFYMADKSYDLVIQVLTSIPERRNKIFPFIEEHINETEQIRQAIKHNFQTLILIDAKKAVHLVIDSWPEFHRIFMGMEPNAYVKFMYMKTINDNPEWQKIFTDQDIFDYFKLICQFQPEQALPMLKQTHTIMFDEALPICMQNRVVDACVHIHTMLGDNEAAVKMISEELQQELVEIIHSGKKVRVTSIDRVRDDDNLIKPYNTIYLAFDLLDKTPELGLMLDEMWRDIFKAFQLPMYLIEKVQDSKTKNSFILFFAFFIVEVIPKTSGDFVMNTLNRDFKIMSQKLLKDVLQAVFMHFDYQKMLSGTVRSLLLEDCKTLRAEASLINTRAANVWSTRCGICNQFITGQGGVGMLVFQCGHCFHNNKQCGGHRTCPVCKGIAAQKPNNEIQLTSRARSNRARALQRVEFGLRQNYGDNQEESLVGNYIYFLPDYPFKAKEKLKFQLATDMPEPNAVFLEL